MSLDALGSQATARSLVTTIRVAPQLRSRDTTTHNQMAAIGVQTNAIPADFTQNEGSAMAAFGFHLYKDKAGQFRWYFEAANGRKLADSGESYFNRQDCIDAMLILADADRGTPLHDHAK